MISEAERVHSIQGSKTIVATEKEENINEKLTNEMELKHSFLKDQEDYIQELKVFCGMWYKPFQLDRFLDQIIFITDGSSEIGNAERTTRNENRQH